MDGEHIRVVHGTEYSDKADKRGSQTPNFGQNIDNIVNFSRVLIPEVMHEEVETHNLFIVSLNRCRTFIQRYGLNRMSTFGFKYRVSLCLQEKVRLGI